MLKNVFLAISPLAAIPTKTQGSVTPNGVSSPWATLCRPIQGLFIFLAGIAALLAMFFSSLPALANPPALFSIGGGYLDAGEHHSGGTLQFEYNPSSTKMEYDFFAFLILSSLQNLIW